MHLPVCAVHFRRSSPLCVCAGGGKCIFLFVHSAQLLVLSGEQASRMPAIYLDAHGEDDPGLHRHGTAQVHECSTQSTKRYVQVYV